MHRSKLTNKTGIALLAGCLGLSAGAGPAAAQGVLDASCPGPPNSIQMTGPDNKVVQTFAAQRTGSLVRSEMEIDKVGNPGNWVMQLLPTDASGDPTNTVLASTTIADGSVPNGPSRLVGVFSSPAPVAAGQGYALALTRSGGTLQYGARTDNPCPGNRWILSGGIFTASLTDDLPFAVYVEPAKPSNAFTVGKAALNKRRGTATLTVNVPSAGELVASGKGVKAASSFPRAQSSKSVPPGSAQLVIRARGKKKRKLDETGKVTLSIAITFTPTGGDPNTQSMKVTLKKR